MILKFKPLLNEQPRSIGKGLLSALKSTVLSDKTKNALNALIRNKEINNVVKYTDSSGVTRTYTLKRYDALLDAFKVGILSKNDMAKVLKTLLITSEDEKVIRACVNYMVKNDKQFRNRYKGLSKKEIKDYLLRGGTYDELQSEIMSDAIFNYKYSGVVQSFKTGFKSSPKVYLPMVKNLSKFKFPLRGFTTEQYKQLIAWLTTGSSRMPTELVQVFRKQGLGPLIATLGGEFVKRYLYLTAVLTALKLMIQILIDNVTPEAERDENKLWISNAFSVLKDVLTTPDLKWVVPAVVTWDILLTVLNPLMAGSGLKATINNINKKISNIETEVSEMESKTFGSDKPVSSKTPTGTTPELTKQVLDAKAQAPEFLRQSIIVRKNEQGKEEIVIAGYLSDGITKQFFPLFKDTDGKWKWRNPENNNIPETLAEY